MSLDSVGVADPWLGRRPAPGLALLVDQLWPERPDSGCVLTLGSPPPGYVVAEQYAVMPSVERARMLMPIPRRAAVCALLAYNQLRRPRTRISKRLTAAVFGLGLGRLVARDRLLVCVPAGWNEQQRRAGLLISHVGAQLGAGPHLAAVGVSAPAPNRKPTVQLFDPAGRPAGYLKVGWNDYTRALVEHETGVLQSLAALAGDDLPRRPAIRFAGSWAGRQLLVTAPLPAAIRRQSPRSWPSIELTGRLGGWGPKRAAPLAGSDYARWLDAELQLAREAGSLTDAEFADVSGYLARVLAEHGQQVLNFAAWHGDWSFWNIGTVGEIGSVGAQVWVWDWEHFGHDRPLGLDLVHYAFQREFVSRERPAAEAIAAVTVEVADRLAALDVPAPAASATAQLYLLELFLRACRMHRSGAGWNPRFRSQALTALRSPRTAERVPRSDPG